MGQWLVLIIILFTSFLQYKSNCASVLPPVYDLINVGTVLFDKSDLSKRCWTDEELIVLNSRREFQNLLPKFDNSSSIQNDQTIVDILDYFNTCLEHVNELSTGNARRLMLRSFADAMGGYLHTYVAPLTKAAFYAGKVKYCNTVKLFRLLVEIKAFLITSGEGWMSPEHIDLFSNVTPLNLTIDPVENACDLLIFNYTAMPRKKYIKRKRRKKKKRWLKKIHKHYRGESCKNGNFRNTVQSFELYLPYFDDDSRPNSIALPLKDRRLWSLYSEESVAILTRYYITSVYCIMSMNNYKENLAGFNKKFHEWLLQSVYPRLKDDRWYPAFGEILRVMALLAVMSGNKYDDKKSSPVPIRNQSLDDTPKENITLNEDSKTASETFNTSQLIVIALLTAAIVWFLVCCSLCCYRSLRKHSSEFSPCKSPVPRVSVLYENQNFGDLETCPSASSSKSMGKKIKDWWTDNVHCSGRCSKQHENDKFSAYKYESRETIRDRKQKKLSKKRKARLKQKTSMDTPTSSSCIVHYQKRVCYMRDSSNSDVSDSSFRY